MPRTTALVLLLALAGCTATMDGTPSTATPAGPLSDLLGSVALDVEPGFVGWHLAPHPDGSFAALLGSTDGADHRHLARVVPGDEPALRDLVEVPALDYDTHVLVTADGTVLVAGSRPADEEGVVVHALRPGADEVDQLYAAPEQGDLQIRDAVLSPDSSTLFLGYRHSGARVRAIDVATGTLVADVPLRLDAEVRAIAARPDGGLSVLLTGGTDRPATSLIDLDADLGPVGEPVDLAPGEPTAVGWFLAATQDGDVLATVDTGTASAPRFRLVTVSDGDLAGSTELTLRDPSGDLAVDPIGRYVYLPTGRDTAPASLLVLDRETGELELGPALCAGRGTLGTVVAAADGRTVAVNGSCEAGGHQPVAFVVG
ncbi:hypothetical protein [Blastococcus sp. SYSU D00820]